MKTVGKVDTLRSIYAALEDSVPAEDALAVVTQDLMAMVEGDTGRMEQVLRKLARLGDNGVVVPCIFRPVKLWGALLVFGEVREVPYDRLVIGYVTKGTKSEWVVGSVMNDWACQQALFEQKSLFNNNRRGR